MARSRELVDQLRGTLPEPPAERRKRLQSAWGYSDLEMRDVVNAGLVETIEETVAAGATPSAWAAAVRLPLVATAAKVSICLSRSMA